MFSLSNPVSFSESQAKDKKMLQVGREEETGTLKLRKC